MAKWYQKAWNTAKKIAPSLAGGAAVGAYNYITDEPGASAKSANPQADADYAEQTRLEQEKLTKQGELVSQLYGQADQYDTERQKALAAMQTQTQNSDAEARRIAAEAMAGASGGSRGGGSAYGELLQTGRQAGDDSRKYMDQRAAETEAFNLSSLDDIASMRNAAKGQDLEAMQAKIDYGTPTQRADKRWSDLQPEIQSIYDKYAGSYSGEQSAAAQDIYNLAAKEPDPVVRQRLNDLGAQVASGQVDI
jgi:hypothetical protein